MKGVIFALALAILLCGCVAQLGEETGGQPTNETGNVGEVGNESAEAPQNITVGPCTAPTQGEVDACLLAEGLCESIKDGNMHDECLLGKLSCGGILDSALRDECNTRALQWQCANATDVGLCKAIRSGDWKHCGSNTACIIGYANATHNSSVCTLISDYNAVACRAIVEGNY
ncbi:MAG: hypothetical protein N3H30_02160, partial [Candidatus Micrarchaeota archaeon]|nr:hypothetical protein [Candidatus Micrarchaeota archaeon]